MEAPPTPPVALGRLLADHELGLRHLAGPAEAELHGVHASEMADPSPYLLGGELLLTAGAGLAGVDAGPAGAGPADVRPGHGGAGHADTQSAHTERAHTERAHTERAGTDPAGTVPAGTVHADAGLAAGGLAAGGAIDAGPYIAQLVRAGVGAVGFGVTPVHKTVPGALIEACERYGLPLVEVPPGTPFTAVGRSVWRLMARARTAELRRVTEAQQSLAAAAARPDPVPAVLRRLAATLGGWAGLLPAGRPDAPSATGRETAGAGTARPAATGTGTAPTPTAGAGIIQPAATWAGAGPTPTARAGTGQPAATGTGAAPAPTAGAGTVRPAAAGTGTAPAPTGTGATPTPTAGPGIVRPGATVAEAGPVVPEGAGARREQGSRAEPGGPGTPTVYAGTVPAPGVIDALGALARRVAPGSAATATAAHDGLHLSVHALGGGRVLALATPSRAPGDHTVASVAAVLLTLLTARRPAGAEAALTRLLLGGDPAGALGPGPWYAVHARGTGDPRALAAALGTVLLDPRGDSVREDTPHTGPAPAGPPHADSVRLLTDREPGPQPGWRLGVSAPTRPEGLPGADAQARRALDRAEAARTPLARHTEPGLAGLVGAAEARAHAEALLGPLSPALRDTLRAWLAHHGSWDRSAAALGIHRNTVRQRIARAAALLSSDLDDPDTRMELWFALRHLDGPDAP
ncbi:helix-turn-helix domain-containing protein [Streptomyces sp. NBC_00193]|uniref:helix-turn-helix domain-containing protein n=1 Tax=Streptomyces sp. NBC_00193 TaxID=2975675 RepID=UPI002258AAB1|nr:helix-turn-helix domain-containing protein [Streptomyces sp. NBC_00193]MCX5298305.1 helix-turn-helix domain-containing protein [Streptomyces sp. NBC_00193]